MAEKFVDAITGRVKRIRPAAAIKESTGAAELSLVASSLRGYG